MKLQLKMKIMLKYFLNSTLLIITIAGNAQNKASGTKGLRLGVDFSQLIVNLFEPERIGIGGELDYEFKRDLFAVVEGGWLDYKIKHVDYNYQLIGIYGLAGIDYNFLKEENRVDNDILFVGLRYGASSFQQNTDNITIINYWGTYTTSFENQQLFGQWVEIVGGLKSELFFAKNVFIGWTLRAKILVSGKNNEILAPYIIPGYGKTEKKFRFGISWFVSYRIPFRN